MTTRSTERCADFASAPLVLVLALAGCAADDPQTRGAVLPSNPAGDAGASAPGALVDAGSPGIAPDAQAAPNTPPAPVAQVDAAAAVCQQLTLDSGRVTPDILIVLDRSSSMRGQGVDRWTPSVSGLKAITAELDKQIRFGLMAFPGRGASGGGGGFLGGLIGGGMSCAPGTLEVPIALGNASAIATSLDALQLVQSTPTATTLQAAHTALGSGKAAADATAVAKYVILVTDGSPNCSDGTQGGPGGNDTVAVNASVNEISAMTNDGIKTFVVGYDTQSDATLKSALDRMAQAGGTGDKEHRPIENEAGLVEQLRGIVGKAIGCEFTLSAAPTDPNYVLVQIDQGKIQLNAADGFSLSPDRRVLTLQGAACAQVQNEKERHLLTVRVECERQTPLL